MTRVLLEKIVGGNCSVVGIVGVIGVIGVVVVVEGVEFDCVVVVGVVGEVDVRPGGASRGESCLEGCGTCA